MWDPPDRCSVPGNVRANRLVSTPTGRCDDEEADASAVDDDLDDAYAYSIGDIGDIDDAELADHVEDPVGGPEDALVLGDPDAAARHWHRQEERNSCAVAAQGFIFNELTGVDHPEAELRAVAAEHGWYDPDNGTSMEDTGKILERYGMATEHHYDAEFADLDGAIAARDSVIVGVNSSEIRNPGTAEDDALADHIGIPGQGADHAVQVTGIDYRDPGGPQVVLNDPGEQDGGGTRVPLETFLLAWEDSGNFLLTAHRPLIDT